MMETLFRGVDDFFWGLSALFTHSPESLMELETPDLEPSTLALGRAPSQTRSTFPEA